KRACMLYIKVSYEESVRRNHLRFRPGQADSILYHSLPDEKMELYYKSTDWMQLAPHSEGKMIAQGIEVPYVVLDNEHGTTDDPKMLGPALFQTCERLWKVKTNAR
ncbi:MAG: hypothetical protein AABZ55_06770, partial [Bdellovibrionota bacterium]